MYSEAVAFGHGEIEKAKELWNEAVETNPREWQAYNIIITTKIASKPPKVRMLFFIHYLFAFFLASTFAFSSTRFLFNG